MDSQEKPICPRCNEDAFDFEEITDGERLVCTNCGNVLDEVELVHHASYTAEGGQGGGVYVAQHDDGTHAGAMQMQDGSAAAIHSFSGHSRVLSTNMDRLNAGLSYLQLPQHIATKATQLLPLVVDAYAAAEPPRRLTAATVAAVIYLAAREEKYALSLGAAGASVSVHGVHVGREFRRIIIALQRPVPPPSLTTLVIRTAAIVLPHYMPSMTGSLRQQPVVKKALDLARLLESMEAADGRSPAVGAAAIMCMCLAEHYKDAKPSTYAAQVAPLLQHDRSSVQGHLRFYEPQLSRLLVLLPFSGGSHGDACVEAAKHAGMLLKLQELSDKARTAGL